jgi:hypothetical protein
MMPTVQEPELFNINPKKVTYGERVGLLETEHATGLAIIKGDKSWIYCFCYEELLDFLKLIEGQIARVKPIEKDELDKFYFEHLEERKK